MPRTPTDLSPSQQHTLDVVEKMLRPLHRLHRYEIRGIEHVPKEGPALVAVNHSFATYDGFLMGMELFHQTGRLMRGLGDDLIFKVPGLGDKAADLGIVPAGPDVGRQLLDDGELVGVAPGGMREALRPTHERYRVRWGERQGFVRLAIEAQVPLVLMACPNGDDLYRVYESPLTKIGYKLLKVPVPVIRGFGPTLLPRPVKLMHVVAPPLHPPKYDAAVDDDATLARLVERFHAQVVTRMNTLMAEARVATPML